MRISSEDVNAPLLIIYSQDGLGLGHMRRTTSIASHLLGLRPDACALTLSDSPLGQFFPSFPNHDYLKLPSIVKAGPGDWRAAKLRLPFNSIHNIREQLIRDVVLDLHPDILLVDHMPHGAMGELLPTLHALKESGAQTKVVLGLRDILDDPAVIQQRWQIEGAYAAVEAYYDLMLVYGMRELFDMAEAYRFPSRLVERLHYCGYVCAPKSMQIDSRLRAKLLNGTRSDTKVIVAMAGGGADAYPMMSTLLDALPAVQRRHRTLLVLITGPFMPPHLRHDLQTRARGLRVRVLGAVEDTHSYLEAADLVVAMAGYNTSVEILESGKPAIFLPRVGPSAEQRMRARLFAARGWVKMLEPENLSVERLAQLILVSLEEESQTSIPDKPNLEGLSTTAHQLLALFPMFPRVYEMAGEIIHGAMAAMPF
jgi:predicted glycosyltransferase